jgi:hypothetical protein
VHRQQIVQKLLPGSVSVRVLQQAAMDVFTLRNQHGLTLLSSFMFVAWPFQKSRQLSNLKAQFVENPWKSW